ncbi:MAG TPA: host attachment protein [Ramlibacter sp.]
MKPNWILVANATEARILQQESGSPLVVLQAFHHPASRARSSELGDDKAGRELSGRGFGGAAFEPRVDAQTKEHLHFARELADALEAAARQGSYGSLAIHASSPFLGELKHALGDGTRRLLTATHDVDLTSFGVQEIEQRLQPTAAR